jgi:hypothetical protein
MSEKVERQYIFSDPCLTTQFNSVVIADIDVFIGSAETIVSLPALTDTASVLYSTTVP